LNDVMIDRFFALEDNKIAKKHSTIMDHEHAIDNNAAEDVINQVVKKIVATGNYQDMSVGQVTTLSDKKAAVIADDVSTNDKIVATAHKAIVVNKERDSVVVDDKDAYENQSSLARQGDIEEDNDVEQADTKKDVDGKCLPQSIIKTVNFVVHQANHNVFSLCFHSTHNFYSTTLPQSQRPMTRMTGKTKKRQLVTTRRRRKTKSLRWFSLPIAIHLSEELSLYHTPHSITTQINAYLSRHYYIQGSLTVVWIFLGCCCFYLTHGDH
jgi:hypothetical protein